MGWLAASGPSSDEFNIDSQKRFSIQENSIYVVDVNSAVGQRLKSQHRSSLFSESWGQARSPGLVVGAGDVLEVSVWEAPPASLFGTAAVDLRAGASAARLTALPEQMVNAAGTINVPFASAVLAAGRLPQDIEADITQRLKGKANQPQVVVQVLQKGYQLAGRLLRPAMVMVAAPK